MSIEENIKRLADAQERTANALEMICTFVEAGVAQASIPASEKIDAPGINAPKKSIVPAPTVTPPMDGRPAGIGAFVPPTTPTPVAPVGVIATPCPTTPEELRLMAQRIAQKAGAKTLEFTAWVNALLVPYGVKTLVTVPQDKIVEVAQKLEEYRVKNAINV